MTAPTRILDTLLDRSVVFSYDRFGYERHRRSFDRSDLEVDLSGRVCLVTGANSGIGLATAEALARLGARVHLLCRNPERGQEALATIKQSCRNRAVYLHIVDVSERSSILAFCRRLREPRVDVLVHNAAVLPDHHIQTSDGLELTLATNLAGPFLLTHLLLDKLDRSGAGRVVFVSSGGMFTQRLVVDELEPSRERFDGVTAYARTKRALVVLASLLTEKYQETGITFNSMHPGWADTPAVKESLPAFYRLTRLILRSPAEAADTVVWLAAAARLAGVSGRFFFDRREEETYPLPFTKESPEEREKLWAALIRWSGLSREASTTATAGASSRTSPRRARA
ncbi:MAG: SDR family NAD(P)-dependent oxidoreductase [Acidobacteria bacterium]|nr:SDR family NAD(P)-dependent oxidoreductase [Acidobacteriota bacterium]MCG3194610.1 hypothetical protein [Thermoanaerobaculia bacterium]